MAKTVNWFQSKEVPAIQGLFLYKPELKLESGDPSSIYETSAVRVFVLSLKIENENNSMKT